MEQILKGFDTKNFCGGLQKVKTESVKNLCLLDVFTILKTLALFTKPVCKDISMVNK